MGILGDYLPNWLPDDPNQNAAARQGLLAAGAALMGGRGNLGGILAGGLMAGQQGYNGALQQQQQASLAAAQQKRWDLENQQTEAATARQSAVQGIISGLNGQPDNSTAAPPQVADAGASILSGFRLPGPSWMNSPAGSAQPDNSTAAPAQAMPMPLPGFRTAAPSWAMPADTAAPPDGGSTTPIASVPSLPRTGQTQAPTAAAAPANMTLQAYNNAIRAGNALVAQGYATEAKPYFEMADKLKPKLKETRSVTLADGKTRALANFFEDGSKQVLDDVNPDLEKLVGYGAGGTYNFANPFTGAVVSSTQMTASPDAKLNRDTQLKVQQMITARQEAADRGEPEAKLAGDELRMMAGQYLAGDQSVMGNLGRGKQGAENIVALRKEITRQAIAAGMSGPDIAAKMAEFQSAKAGMRTAATRNATIEIAASEVNQLAPIALEASANVTRSGLLPFGKAGIMFDASTNNPNLRKFAMANNALVNAYGQAMARGGTATVNDKQHAEQLLSTAMDQPSYEAAVQQLMVETKAAQAAPKEVAKQLSGGISGRAHTIQPVSALPQKAPATGAHPADISALLNKYGTR